MHLIVNDPKRGRVDAILLAANAACMRLIAQDDTDTVEVRFADGRWVSDDGSAIELEALLAGDFEASPEVWAGMHSRVQRAGA